VQVQAPKKIKKQRFYSLTSSAMRFFHPLDPTICSFSSCAEDKDLYCRLWPKFIAGRLYLLFFFSLPLTCLQSPWLLRHRLDLDCCCRHLHPFLLISPLSLHLLMPNRCCLMIWDCLCRKVSSNFGERIGSSSLEKLAAT
jgi:hypothetical protein